MLTKGARDINVPVRQDGCINREHPNLRLKTYGRILDLYSRFSSVVVMATRGGGANGTLKFNDHYNVLSTVRAHRVHENLIYFQRALF